MIKRRLHHLLIFGLALCLLWLSGCDAPPPEGWDNNSGVDAGADVPVEHPTLTVATYNVYLLFDTVCDSGQCDSGDFEREPTEAEYQARIEQVADAIRGLEADVVLLQEIEKEEVLFDLQEALDGAYPVAVHGELDWEQPGSVDTAVLATGELINSRGYSDRRLTRPNGTRTWFAREFLRVDLQINGERTIVFTAHFVSKANGDDSGRRLAEAQEARAIIDEVAAANEDALIVFGGDLNDTPDSEPLAALTGDDGLYRAGDTLATDEFYTYVYQQQRQAIDHLLLAPTSGGGYVSGSARAVHDNDDGYGGSDHGAVVGQFLLR